MRPVFATLFWLALAAAPPLRAAASPPPANWTADDLVHAQGAADWTVSEDGAAAAWVQSEVVAGDAGEQTVAQVWLARLNGNGREAGTAGSSTPAVRMTRGIEQASHPRFSPDSRRLAFLSDRAPAGGGEGAAADGTDQVWILPLSGGEA
ncbi:MAG TPA: hypothetical protein VN851_24860, partial [Thermoanaerobaculia bacterium]|nr:hypothetical protein [Thermoanaerobaculia bacterium]